MIQSVVFDMEGTLFQTETILELALDDTFAHLRAQQLWDKETPIETYREIMGAPLSKVWETLLPYYTRTMREKVDRYLLKKLIKHIGSGKGELYPNVKEIFSYLKENNYEIYIASNGLIEDILL